MLPDFPQGGLMDAQAYDDGRGHVLVRARIEKKDERTLVIRELPFGATTDSLMASIEDAARKGKIKIKSINDFTAGQAEIEIQLPPGAGSRPGDRSALRLHAVPDADLQPHRRHPRQQARRNGCRRRSCATTRRGWWRSSAGNCMRKRRRLTEEMHHQTLVRLFVENRIYKRIETCDSAAAVQQAVLEGLQPFRGQLAARCHARGCGDAAGHPHPADFALRSRKEPQGDRAARRRTGRGREGPRRPCAVSRFATCAACCRKYGADYPRRTRLAHFGEISERELTANELTIAYDREKGYIGHKIAGEPLLSCSPLDRLLLVWKDGRCKVVPPPEKLFVDTSLIYGAILDRERVMTAVYECDLFTHIKKFAVGGLITNREYRMAPKGAVVRFFADDDPPTLYVRYAADARAKIRQQEFAVDRLPVRDREAMGPVMTSKRMEFVGADKARRLGRQPHRPARPIQQSHLRVMRRQARLHAPEDLPSLPVG